MFALEPDIMSTNKFLLCTFVEICLHVHVRGLAGPGTWIKAATLAKFYFNISTSNVARCENICLRQKACAAATFDIFERICYLHERRYPAIGTSGRYLIWNLTENEPKEVPPCGYSELLVPTAHSETGTCKPIKICPYEKEFKMNKTAGICYKFVIDVTKTWHGARDACAAEGAHLMRFRNYDDWAVIRDEIAASPELSGSDFFWIDGNDEDVDGRWKNTDNAELSWLFWGPDQPTRGWSEKYLNLNGYGGRNFQMNDAWDNSSPFICQCC